MLGNKIDKLKPGSREAALLYRRLVSPLSTDLAPANMLISQQSSRSQRPGLRRFFRQQLKDQLEKLSESSGRLYSAKLRRQDISSKEELQRQGLLRKSQLKLQNSESKRQWYLKELTQQRLPQKIHFQQINSKYTKSSRQMEEKSFQKMRQSEMEFISYLQKKRRDQETKSRELVVRKAAEREHYEEGRLARLSAAKEQQDELIEQVLGRQTRQPQYRARRITFSVNHETKARQCLDHRIVQQSIKQRKNLHQYLEKMDGRGKAKRGNVIKQAKKDDRKESVSPPSNPPPCARDHFKMVEPMRQEYDSGAYARKLSAIKEMKLRELQQRVEEGELFAQANLAGRRQAKAEKQLRQKAKDVRLRAQFRLMSILKGWSVKQRILVICMEVGGRRQEQLSKNVFKIRSLGKGGAATVWLAKEGPQSIAVKEFQGEHNCASFKREVAFGQVLAESKDPRRGLFVRYLGHVSRKVTRLIKYEVGGSSLSKALYSIKGEFLRGERVYRICPTPLYQSFWQLGTMQQFVRQVAEALSLLRGLGCSHNDIKPDNILIEEERLPQVRVKLCDFGSVSSADDKERGMLTAEYMAPELLRGKSSENADCWSLGIVLCQIIVMIPIWLCYTCVVEHHGYKAVGQGALASKSKSYKHILSRQPRLLQDCMRRVRECGLYAPRGEQFALLLAGLLEPQPAGRLSPDQILGHAFLQ